MAAKKQLLSTLIALCAPSIFASSHNDAPMIQQDPVANFTDVYAFVGMNGSTKVLNVMMAVNPLEDPGNGVNYYRFGEDVLYSLHIAKANSNGTFSGERSINYNFRFSPSYKNLNTILSYGLGTEAGPINNTGDARQNFVQSYTVTKTLGNSYSGQNLAPGQTLWVPPVNVGPRTTPGFYRNGVEIQGAVTNEDLDVYTRETIYGLNDGSRVWCGQREDGFYADVPAIFDLLGIREPGKDGFSGYNVHTIAMQIPVSEIVKGDDVPIVGVYASSSRRTVRVLSPAGDSVQVGPWIQVSRLGNPLFNEAAVALKDKDRYNRSRPTQDVAVFRPYAVTSELAFLMNTVLGTNFQVTDRTDLVAIFIPDLLKVDTSTAPVPLSGQADFNRLSVFGGDTTFSSYQNMEIASGWPNGRRFGDDVVDIALTAIASGPSYTKITPVSDNMNANDSVYHLTFPYAGTPWGGPTTSLH
ncbi:MAG: DUF4331 domain-containing protein [Fimbriimonadales bacterium]